MSNLTNDEMASIIAAREAEKRTSSDAGGRLQNAGIGSYHTLEADEEAAHRGEIRRKERKQYGRAGIVQARECRGVNIPDQIQVESSPLSLNGLGVRKATMLKVNVYVAALYVVRPSSDPKVLLSANSPTELSLYFLRDVGAADMREAWSGGFAKNAKERLPTLEERIAMLNGWMADMKVGRRLIFSFKPGVGVTINVNGTARGTIKGDNFAGALFSIWLGADPPNSEIKAGLLGGACGW
jgi:hypothetical protein